MLSHDKIYPFASTGPQDFVKKLRDALESDHVSNTLNHWIDLIFGCKQTGSEAEKADNCEHINFIFVVIALAGKADNCNHVIMLLLLSVSALVNWPGVTWCRSLLYTN
jgi:hypothetical protein